MRYLFLTYYTKPDGKIDEVMTLATKIKSRDHQMVNVILDFKELKVVKSTVGGESTTKDWDTIVSYFYQHYSATIERLFEENGHHIDIKAEIPPGTAV